MSSSLTRSPGAPTKGERTKVRILEAAIALFTEQGFNGTSVRDIAAKAEITHAGLLHHFPGKDEMLVRILEFREQQEVDEYVRYEQHGDADLFFAWVLAIVRNNEAHPDRVQLFVRLLAEATDSAHPARAYFTRRYARLFEVTRSQFERHFAEVAPSLAVTPDEAARQTIALMDGLQIQWLLTPEQIDMPAHLAAHLRRLGVDVDTALEQLSGLGH